jgi:hypothetical protein
MYRRGRPVDEYFKPNEHVYRRYFKNDYDLVRGVLLPSALRFPKKDDLTTGSSVNRSSLSRAEDALWTNKQRLPDAGVYQFPLACLPAEEECPKTGRRFTFFPKHVPLWNNYAHTEIWCDSLPRANAAYVLPTEEVKKVVRAMIQKNHRIAIRAAV